MFHGRFPFQGRELAALSPPTLLLWAEAGAEDPGRAHPPAEHAWALAKATGGELRLLPKGQLAEAPPSVGLTSEADHAMLIFEGEPRPL